VKAIILSAGQGKRLLPLTQEVPKCLLPVGREHTLLSWQLAQLAEAGVDEAVVVTGFESAKVEGHLAEQSFLPARAVFNPFFDVADNLASVWCALGEFGGDTILLNGDTLFASRVPASLAEHARSGITLTVSRKATYDDDDMKVQLDGTSVRAIAKTLESDRIDGESIGMTLLRGDGPAVFRRAVEHWMRRPDRRDLWYLSVLDALSREVEVATHEAAQDEWCEVDVADDVRHARDAVDHWAGTASRPHVAAVS